MKILYTTPVLEHPPVGGPQLRVENSLKALSRLSEVHLVSRQARFALGGADGERFYRSLSGEFRYAPTVDGLSETSWRRFVQRKLRRGLGVEEDARFICGYADRHCIGVIWFGYGNISFPLIRRVKELSPHVRAVCDTDSVWSRFLSRSLPFETDPARREDIRERVREKEREERLWVDLCEITAAVSEVDAAYYRSLASDSRRIALFPNAIDLDTYRALPSPPEGFRKPCLYVGGSFYTPHDAMTRAARWVIEEVLPEARALLPDIHVYIVGSNSDRVFADVSDAAVTVAGRVPSVLPYARHADVALVPLHFESGTRFKILEAAACGVPVVSTTLGAEGLPVVHGTHLLIADDSASFARAAVSLIREKEYARDLAQNARQLVREQFGISALEARGREILRRLQISGGGGN